MHWHGWCHHRCVGDVATSSLILERRKKKGNSGQSSFCRIEINKKKKKKQHHAFSWVLVVLMEGVMGPSNWKMLQLAVIVL